MPAQLEYTPLERLDVLRPVDRIEYAQRMCAGKTVLDLGAMDETAYLMKRGKGTWLHEELGKTAKKVIGLDSSALIPVAGLRTGDNSIIYRGDITNVGSFLEAHSLNPDVIVAGELIEHLPNPLLFLESVKRLEQLSRKTLLLTTPNATALHNVLVGLAKRESTHQDHLCILSYKTLNTLIGRAGFRDWELRPYYSHFTEMKERCSSAGKKLVGASESVIHLAEWLFPLLSFGWVAKVHI